MNFSSRIGDCNCCGTQGVRVYSALHFANRCQNCIPPEQWDEIETVSPTNLLDSYIKSLETLGIDAGKAGTELRKALQELIKANENVIKELRDLGLKE